MRQAISTKYLGATNYRGSRIKATSASGHSLTVDYDDALNGEENHARAARALTVKLNWTGKYYGGATKDGYCFVYADESDAFVSALNGSTRHVIT